MRANRLKDLSPHAQSETLRASPYRSRTDSKRNSTVLNMNEKSSRARVFHTTRMGMTKLRPRPATVARG